MDGTKCSDQTDAGPGTHDSSEICWIQRSAPQGPDSPAAFVPSWQNNTGPDRGMDIGGIPPPMPGGTEPFVAMITSRSLTIQPGFAELTNAASTGVAVPGNRRAFRVMVGPMDSFRRYCTVFAREQAARHFSEAMVRYLEQTRGRETALSGSFRPHWLMKAEGNRRPRPIWRGFRHPHDGLEMAQPAGRGFGFH